MLSRDGVVVYLTVRKHTCAPRIAALADNSWNNSEFVSAEAGGKVFWRSERVGFFRP